MKDQVVRAVFAAVVIAVGCGSAWAATLTWTGEAGDGKWSTPGNWSPVQAPAKGDSVVFSGDLGAKGASTVDSDFTAEYVANLTLAKDFTGSVTLGRDFWVFRVYDQSAGTFNGGSYRFTVGTSTRGAVNFYHRGGTFNAPDAAGEFRFDFSYEATDFVSTGGVFNANGGTVTILSSFTASANAHNWLVYNRTFYNLNFADGTFAPTYRGKGTNTIENAFTFRNGVFKQPNDKYVVFNVLKDCYIGGHTAGGPAVINICGDGEQHVYGDASDCKSISLDVRKTSGKVYFHGEKLRFGRGENAFDGVRFLSGEIDLSDVDQMAIESYNANPPLRVDEAAHVVWPTTLKISNAPSMTFLGCVGQEFNNLELTHAGQCNIPYAITNTVNGTLILDGCSLENSKLNWSWLPLPNNESIQAAFILKGDLLWRRNGTPSTGGGVKMIFAGDRHQYVYTDAEDVHVSSIIVRKTPGSVLTAVGTNGVLKVGSARHAPAAYGDVFALESGTFEFPTNCLAMHSCGNAYYRQIGGTMVPGKAEFRIESCSNSQLLDFIDPFYDLAIKHGVGTSYVVLNGNVNVTNDLKILGGHVRGGSTFNVYGDWIQEGVLGSANWTANVRLAGDRDQTFRTTDATQNTYGKITVEKSGGSFSLDTDFYHRNNNNCTFELKSGTIKPNGHRFLLQKMSVSDGAGVAFRPPLDEIEPMIETAGALTLPTSGAVQLDVLGKIEPECVTHVPLFGYGSVSNYSKDRWNVRSWAPCARAPRKSVPLVENVTGEKRLYFNWRYAYGMCISIW